MPHFAEYAPDSHGVPIPDLGVRIAREEDIPAVARLMAADGTRESRARDNAAVFVRDVPVALVGVVDDVVVAWSGARYFENDDPEEGWISGWYVAGLSVDAQYRRKHVAQQVLADVKEHVASRTRPGVPLFSVINARNGASIALHHAAGFAEVTRGATFIGITFDGGLGVLMRSGC